MEDFSILGCAICGVGVVGKCPGTNPPQQKIHEFWTGVRVEAAPQPYVVQGSTMYTKQSMRVLYPIFGDLLKWCEECFVQCNNN